MRVLLLAAACGMAACSSPGTGPLNLAVQVEPMATPADTLSGEPFLISTPHGVAMSWVDRSPGGHTLRMADLGEDGWSTAKTIAEGDNWFVNWADVPTIMQSGTTTWAHWLEYNGSGKYSYGIRVAKSTDDGTTWSQPEWLHEDRSPSEHGFAAMAPVGEEMYAVWLDGRQWAEGIEQMSVRSRALGHVHGDGESPEGMPMGDEHLVDARACDCCPNAVVALGDRGLIAAYRNRSADEIRDIHVVRMIDGQWETPLAVHEDGWQIKACPVNGPALASRGDRVAIAWFTAPNGQPEVRVAFSDDLGATFGPPHTVSSGGPIGRVDVVLLKDGSAVTSWIEASGGQSTQDEAGLMARRVTPDGRMSDPVVVVPTSASRASGYPRMVRDGEDLVLAWTATSPQRRVETARVALEL